MVHLAITPRISHALSQYNSDLSRPPLPLLHNNQAIDHKILHTLSLSLSLSFSTLLLGTSIYTPPPPPVPKKSPEYEALMIRLRREAEEREYHTLLQSPDSYTTEDEEMTWKEVKSQVTTIFNVLLTTFATAGAVWKAAEGWDEAERVAVAFLSAIVVVVAEVALFWGFVKRVDAGSVRGMGKKRGEEEVVVKTWEVVRGVVEEVEGKKEK